MTTTEENLVQPEAEAPEEEQPIDEPDAPQEEPGEEGGQQPSDEDPAAEPQEELKPQENAEAKKWRDKANITNGQLATVTRTLKALKDKGLLTDEAIEEAAEAQGVDVRALRSVLSQEPAPADPAQANAQKLIEQFNPQKPGDLKLAMDEAYGEDTQKYFDAFDFLIGVDKSEGEALADVEPSKVVAYVIRKGKEFFSEYEELKAHGSILHAYRASKAPAKPAPQPPKQNRTPLNSSASVTPKPRQPGRSFYDAV